MSRDDRYYNSVGKSRRTPPGDPEAGVGFFNNYQGQGGRTVLPPLSAAFPTSHFPVPSTNANQYSRGEYNTATYNQWPNTAAQTPLFLPYDTRYQAQAYPSSGYPTRTSPPIPPELHGLRRLPPLNTKEERWQAAPTHAAPQAPVMNNVRSPTAGYPPTYIPYPSNQYSYPAAPDPRNVPHSLTSMGHHPQHMHAGSQPPTDRMTSSRNEARSASPYGRNSSAAPTAYTQAPAAPPAEEPVVKKKRKRADAAQLKVLTETYNRTAFPSTEERAELAKKLDMSARSVQIWFQNKRQSMRQTGRQNTAATTSSHRPFSMAPQVDTMADDDSNLHLPVGDYASGSMGMGMNAPSPSYISRSQQDSSRSAPAHLSTTMASSHRHPRNHEESHDHNKWSGY